MKKILIFFIFIIPSIVLSQTKEKESKSKYWIIFKDKGVYKPNIEIKPGSDAEKVGLNLLTERAIKRRLKVLPPEKLIDFMDLPLNESYINKIISEKIDIIAKSRWLNGVSAYLTKSEIEKIKKTGIVSHFRIVDKMIPAEFNEEILEVHNSIKDSAKYKFDYGNSLKQMEMVNVPLLHKMGFSGEGVMITSLDDGFDWKNHEALKDLKITFEYDFINEDNNTAPELNQKYFDTPTQGGHGTATLSAMSGFMPGKLIGPAFNSEIILAKSEYVPTETPMEEDFWLEACEWAEALGTDIITSSLIYRNYDEEYKDNSYKYEMLNGDVPIATFAGDRCTYLGVAVFQAMGNYNQTIEPSLGSAADGDSVISVGAVMFNGMPANFTSNGPNSKGQIKPDISAPGVSIYVARLNPLKNGKSLYEYSNGTSFSTPISAGIAALILEAHPELTPMQLRDALRMTASQSGKPDNVLGWGIVNGFNAALYPGMIFSPYPELKLENGGLKISTYIASNIPIDLKSVKVFYNDDGTSWLADVPMILTDEVFDNNGSGRYECFIEGVTTTEFLSYFILANDIDGNEREFKPKKKD